MSSNPGDGNTFGLKRAETILKFVLSSCDPRVLRAEGSMQPLALVAMPAKCMGPSRKERSG